jgi:hypothetical protein
MEIISSVMPTTSRRLWCLDRSIRCWRRQSWPARDLLILSDGPGREEIAAMVALAGGTDHAEGCIRHVHLDETPGSLGEKWNIGFGMVGGPYCHMWGDDDWQHPNLLEVVMRAREEMGVRIAGTNTMMAWRPADKTAWMYWSPQVRPHLVGGTIVFHRAIWEQTKFPHAKRASDTAWQLLVYWPADGAAGGEEFAMVSDPRLYIAWVHDENTGNALGTEPEEAEKREVWERVDEWDPGKIITEDRAAFGFAP